MAWIRVLLASFITVLFTVLALNAGAASDVTPLCGLLILPLPLFAWPWLWISYHRPYRSVLTLVSVVFDGASLTLLWQLPEITQTVLHRGLLDGLAILFLAFCMFSGACVRHNPVKRIVVGTLFVGFFAVISANANQYADISRTAEPLRFYGAAPSWRYVVLAFTVVIVAFVTRDARRLARESAAAVAEQLLVMDLFGRFVDARVARDILAHDVRTEVRTATVLFTDLQDFTALSERISPEELFETLRAYYATIIPAVHASGGTVNKFIGDAIMAVFGAPLPLEDHALRAVMCAMKMQESIHEFNAQQRGRDGPELTMRVGIASGPVVVGILGGPGRVEYAIIGDTVNVAARLEALNKELHTQILLSESTQHRLGGALPISRLGTFPIRGKADAMQVFTVLSQPAA